VAVTSWGVDFIKSEAVIHNHPARFIVIGNRKNSPAQITDNRQMAAPDIRYTEAMPLPSPGMAIMFARSLESNPFIVLSILVG